MYNIYYYIQKTQMHLLVFLMNFIRVHPINASKMELANWNMYYLILTYAQNKMGFTI